METNTNCPSNNENLRIRFVLLQPYTVAAYQYIGENPEEHVGAVLERFVQESKLFEIKPDARFFGFNHPNPSPDSPVYGYESQITIPDDMVLPEPLVKKQMKGGWYAALTIDFPNFREWDTLCRWADANDVFEPDYDPQGEEIMGGLLEEHLNWVYAASTGRMDKSIDGKIDLLLPIKKRK